MRFELFATLALALLAAPLAEARQANPVDADPARMAAARAQMFHGMGAVHSMIMADRFEFLGDGEQDAFLWDGQGWIGGDLNKFWVKAQGEYGFDSHRLESAEIQALYSRAISPYFDLQTGLRHNFGTGPDTSYAVIGLQGLAPYWFEINAEAFVSDRGDLSARFEAEYDLMLTQRLILQPRAEVQVSGGDVRASGLASGVTETELGVRLRYEIQRGFAPYLGIEWHDLQGGTADLARLGGERASERVIAVGIRFWF